MSFILGGPGIVKELKKSPHGRRGLRWLLMGLPAFGLSVLALAPVQAQEATEGAAVQLQFQQFRTQPWPTQAGPQAGQAHRAYPFGIYRADNLNNFGPEYYGWSHLPPNQPWRGGSINTPSRQRYGLDNKTAEEESSADE